MEPLLFTELAEFDSFVPKPRAPQFDYSQSTGSVHWEAAFKDVPKAEFLGVILLDWRWLFYLWGCMENSI